MGFTANEVLTARRNFRLIRNKFTRIDITVAGKENVEKIKKWLRENTQSLFLSKDGWRYLDVWVDDDEVNPEASIMEEPTMEEIMASIRRIISEDNDDVHHLQYYFIEDSDAVVFKLTWGGK